MGWLRRCYLTVASEFSWRVPGRPQRLLGAFALAERGSMLDMFAAVEATKRRDMRKKYFHHGLDEGRHALIFAERVRAFGLLGRAEAAMEDSGQLLEAGIVGGQTLFERLGEPEFMAFVYVAEADAVEQFNVYLDRGLPDDATQAQLRAILKDEVFHVTYSRTEVDKYRKDGLPMDATMRKIRLRRVWERLLRFSRDFGSFTSGIWLSLLYFLVLGPFRLFGRLEAGGWHPVEGRAGDALALARSEG